MRHVYHIRSGEMVDPSQGLEPLRQSDQHYWVDLLQPTKEEVAELERFFHIELPTVYEMQEIETSSRLYRENGALFLTATLLAHADTDEVSSAPVSFILFRNTLITVRYIDNSPFRNFLRLCSKPSHGFSTNSEALSALLEAVIDRLADILEKIGLELDAISSSVFHPQSTSLQPQSLSQIKPREQDNRLKELLVKVGRNGGINSKARESLVSLNRLLVYLIDDLRGPAENHPLISHVKGLGRDLSSLSDHCNFLSGKINFLLDAILGLINIEQNQIIKIFSIAAVIFLPPTVIASMYGMNFKYMPETEAAWGYPMAVLLMVISAIIPYWYFHRKGWI